MPGGELHIVGADGAVTRACPLQHTDVEADIAGFTARVTVKQTFHNPLDDKIEAVYVFPLPKNAAVDSMVMVVGDRRVVGDIKPRDEARRIYQQAVRAGHVAGLLDQERPNIFTQSVANIEPGARVVIEIAYVETLAYDEGVFEFVFPMVVGPRYMPGAPAGKQGAGWARDTTDVPDASRISPPVAPPGTRSGHDIDLVVHIDAGTEVFDIESELHDVVVRAAGSGRATIALEDRATIPNRDFVLRYRTATDEIEDAFLVHEDERGRFFTLVLQPPRRVAPEQARPKEMIFVIDRSGSMSGFPIEKAKETMRLAIESMNPDDTFNLLSFSGGTGRCFDKPVPNTRENRAIALKYLADLYGSGGTEMMKAIRAALEGQADPERVRIVAFMTDGYIGNDFAIIDAVKKNAGTARVFAFGIGNSVNRFLLDGMAHAGRGEVEYVTLESQGDAAATRFHERIHAPVLTDIEVDWGTLPVADVYPKRIPDLFSVKPITIHGRLEGPAQGSITLRGNSAAGRFEEHIDVSAPEDAADHPALASLWARAKIRHLTMQDYSALQAGNFPDDLRKEITALGVEYSLMTQFTSFVAVEEMTVTVGGEPKTVAVPVEMPDGVSYAGVFGHADGDTRVRAAGKVAAPGVQARLLAAVPVASEYVARPVEERAQVRLSGAIARNEAETDALLDQAVVPKPRAKLDAALTGLADKVAKGSKRGDLTVAGVRVRGFRIEVMVYLRDTSEKTRKALEKAGFVQTGESKTMRLVTGSIDVRKLEELAGIDAVLRVSPLQQHSASTQPSS
jgi:Ca-activated chloride channel family protein